MSTETLRPAPGVASRVVAGEAVIVRLPDGEMTVLNESATVLWNAANGVRSRDEIAAELQRHYGLDTLPDIHAIVTALIGAHLLEDGAVLAEALAATELPSDGEPYQPPAVQAQEPLETLAGTCPSGYNPPLYSACRTPGEFCFDPWE